METSQAYDPRKLHPSRPMAERADGLLDILTREVLSIVSDVQDISAGLRGHLDTTIGHEPPQPGSSNGVAAREPVARAEALHQALSALRYEVGALREQAQRVRQL